MAIKPSSPVVNLTKSSRIAVLGGGLSSEREVSLRSANNVLAALQRLGYANAYLLTADEDLPNQLVQTKPDVVFNVLHGAYGEDGAVQGLLEWLHVPYTGNRLKASAVGMDKALSKLVYTAAGLPVLRSTLLNKATYQACGVEALVHEAPLSYPLMVKPLNQGSSVGMSKVDSPDALPAALTAAFETDDAVMLEPFAKGRDMTIGVVLVEGELKVTPVLELRCPQDGWYTLEAKYTHGRTEFILPAPLPPEETAWLQSMALQAHKALGCHGVSRTDFVYVTTQQAYLLETNTSPGMTDLSDLPAQCAAMGLPYDGLVEALLQTALNAS
jgi:D-alanine-D-alanine ligase